MNPQAHNDGSPLAPNTMVDHFKVAHLLDRGGMGDVYLARDTQLGRKVALKLVRREDLGDQEAKESFLFEARVTAQFSHPHIVTIYAVGEYAGQPYLALEYLDGQSLGDRLLRGPLGALEAARIGLTIAAALGEAHRHNILHRDLKSENVFLAKDGRLRVLDFGLARVVKPETRSSHPPHPEDRAAAQALLLSQPSEGDEGDLVGTPNYMAPECWSRDKVGPATDVFALGVVLFEMLEGQPPFRGPTWHAIQYAVCNDETPHIEAPDVPVAFKELVTWCLAKQPEDRPTVAKVTAVLGEVIAMGRGRGRTDDSPFRGLLPFTEAHAGQFFGRDEEVGAFVERLRDEPLLAVVGPSGAGKSSFVQAGVVPRLREQRPWLVLVVRPGGSPFEALSGAIVRAERQTAEVPAGVSMMARSPESASEEAELAAELLSTPGLLGIRLVELAEQQRADVLLFVDQLEELVALVEDEDVRRRFMEALSAAADDVQAPVRVVVTLRDDFLGQLAEGPAARRALSQVVVLRSPGPSALAEIASRPLSEAGYAYEDPQLPAVMAAAVQGEAASLPLLQFALGALWKARDRERKLIPLAAYTALGGVEGALAGHADGIMAGLSPQDLRAAKEIFLRLVTPSRTRRAVIREELLSGLPETAVEVLDRLVQERVLVAHKGRGEGHAELEIVHESLIRRWETLARWLDESREEHAFLTEAGQAAAAWEKHGRRADELWQGDALRDAERLAARLNTLPEDVRHFLVASRHHAQRLQQRRRRVLSFAFVFLAVVAVGLFLISREAERQRGVAQRQRGEAQRQQAEAQLAGARTALGRGDPFEARARLRLALETGDSRLARSLWWRLVKEPLVWNKTLGASVYGVAYSPEGNTVAAACMDHSVYLFDLRTTGVRILRGHTDQVLSVSYSPDGLYLASSSWGGDIRIWELSTGRSRVLSGHTQAIAKVAFSPNGVALASASFDKTVRLWDAKSGRQTAVLRGHDSRVRDVAFNPAGTMLASAGYDNMIRLWDIKSGKQTAVLQGHHDSIMSVSFDPNGTLLASAGDDKTVRLWDVKSGKQTAVLQGHHESVYCVSFSPKGTLLASAGDDKEVWLWDVKSGRQTASFSGHDNALRGVAFSPDGTKLVTGGFDNTVRLWEVALGGQTAAPQGHRIGVEALAFDPLGKLVASAGFDKTVRLWDVQSGKQIAVLPEHQLIVRGVDFSPDGELLASGSETIRLWNVKSGRQIASLSGHDNLLRSVAFSPDGTTLATGSSDKTVRLWDVQSERQTAVFRGHQSAVFDVAFSPGGTLLASSGEDKTVRLWDIKTQRESAVFLGHESSVDGVDFSPDGALLASGSTDKTVRLWDLKTGTGRILGRHLGRVYGAHFHPDGRRVGTPSADRTARIWDISNGEYIELLGHRAEVNNILFSPDGKLAATASDDGTVRLWEADTGIPVWRAPLLRPQTLELFTHNGWLRLASQPEAGHPPTPARWRTAVEQTARLAADSGDGKLLCLGTHRGTLELWDLAEDRQLAATKVPDLAEVVAVPGGCVSLASGNARRHDRAGTSQEIHEQATAIAWDQPAKELLVAAGDHVWVYGPDGTLRGRFPAGAGAIAVGRMDAWIAVGYQDGNIELLPTKDGQTKPTFTFEQVPASPLVRIIPGPMGTLIAGYANGLLGMWSLQNGKMLEHAKLHGPVAHLLIKGTRLYAATVLGSHTTWDLSMFHIPYCELLRQVWQKVPIVWEEGLPVLRPPPPKHHCQL